MRQRIYVDTSVIGGCLDSEFQEYSNKLFEMFGNGKAIIVLSDLTLLELKEAPEKVRALLSNISEDDKEYVELTEEANVLALQYIDSGVVESRKKIDAQHIAIATVGRVDVLVSWNFKHIVNLRRIHGFNSVNMRLGYPLLEIRTPQEVTENEEE